MRFVESAFGVAFVVIVALLALSIRPTPTPGPEATTAVATPGGASLLPTPTWRPSPSAGSSSPMTPGSATPVPTTHGSSGLGKPVRWLRGQATWWNSLGGGIYVAVNPSDGIRVGALVQVCDAHAQDCQTARVVTTCACLGHDSGRIVDLSLDLFARFADPSRGVTTVVLEVVP